MTRVVAEVGHESQGAARGDGDGVGLETDRGVPDDLAGGNIDLRDGVITLVGHEHVLAVRRRCQAGGKHAGDDRLLRLRRDGVDHGHGLAGVGHTRPGGHVGGGGGRCGGGGSRGAAGQDPDPDNPMTIVAPTDPKIPAPRRAGSGPPTIKDLCPEQRHPACRQGGASADCRWSLGRRGRRHRSRSLSLGSRRHRPRGRHSANRADRSPGRSPRWPGPARRGPEAAPRRRGR